MLFFKDLLIWIYYHISWFQIPSIELIWLFSLEVQTGIKEILSHWGRESETDLSKVGKLFPQTGIINLYFQVKLRDAFE